ncbi:MAG: hypothetical protein ACKVQT_08715, partial [Burkholderiales bacterium]
MPGLRPRGQFEFHPSALHGGAAENGRKNSLGGISNARIDPDLGSPALPEGVSAQIATLPSFTAAVQFSGSMHEWEIFGASYSLSIIFAPATVLTSPALRIGSQWP